MGVAILGCFAFKCFFCGGGDTSNDRDSMRMSSDSSEFDTIEALILHYNMQHIKYRLMFYLKHHKGGENNGVIEYVIYCEEETEQMR